MPRNKQKAIGKSVLGFLTSSKSSDPNIFVTTLHLRLFGVIVVPKLVDNFVHRPGVHCESSALRDIFEFYGFKFSEPMIFGLGCGLGFVYWRSRQMPYPFVGGRGRDLYKNLCCNLGVKVKVNRTSTKTRAYETLKDLINKDIPVMIHVDMPYLKYLRLPEQAHFGAHVVVIAGIDEEKGTAYIADTMFKGLQTATLKELEEARSSTFKPFPPENKWFTFEFPEKLTQAEVAIRNAITQTAKSMLYPPIKNLGVKGINHFASEIVKWPKLFPPENASFRQLYEVNYVMMEEDGTGGGLFRYLYSRFLKEVGEMLNNKKLADIGQRYHEIGQKWTTIARLVRETSKNVTSVHEARKILLGVAKEETEVFSFLARIFQ